MGRAMKMRTRTMSDLIRSGRDCLILLLSSGAGGVGRERVVSDGERCFIQLCEF